MGSRQVSVEFIGGKIASGTESRGEVTIPGGSGPDTVHSTVGLKGAGHRVLYDGGALASSFNADPFGGEPPSFGR